MLRHRVARACLVLSPMAFLAPSASSQCVSGTVSAELQKEGSWVGLYKYTIEIVWETPRGLSNVALDFGMEACPSSACAVDWFFDPTAGSGHGGDPNSCDFTFQGEFNCHGNPSIGVGYPVLKWDAISDGACEADGQGTAALSFYSAFPPTSPLASAILIKNGQFVCEGRVEGLAPLVCPVPVQRLSWSLVKSFYRSRSEDARPLLSNVITAKRPRAPRRLHGRACA